jgi:hypothetical protein
MQVATHPLVPCTSFVAVLQGVLGRSEDLPLLEQVLITLVLAQLYNVLLSLAAGFVHVNALLHCPALHPGSA